ncbi:sodium:solute symporter family protein [Actomonas aquatica]|uniref:Transporter n=1 Tax=Actomonas aquatica TaxID=2866162 RepID=A0ABZ1C8P1_9BACT|nr:hypothetical protein [Opitutus sp. WL0086]WRQ87846.1 hypothetical protein K1X11_000390 [Opitutus sp. WL0086]
MNGIHFLDILVFIAYMVVVIYLGRRSSHGNTSNQEGYFLAGRKLGKVYQFFLNFGNATDANGAVSAASMVYQQGVSGVWLGFQLIFLNPYYWFMNTWFRRVRLVTTADLFEDRLGSRKLASFYAVFQSLAAMFVVIGFGNLVTYKICAALVTKPEVQWTVEERSAVEGHAALHQLEMRLAEGPLGETEAVELAMLRERDARGELRSFVTALQPFSFYLCYTLVVGIYVVAGGMAATAMNEVLQSIIIVAFSVILVPAGLVAIGGFDALRDRVPANMFELVGSNADLQQITGLSLFALFLVAIIQINGIIGNMGISGSAKNEYAARLGAVTGTYAKRLMFILWAFAGLIAVAMFSGADTLADPDLAWGTMSRQLLGPGMLGLMITGVLAANMSTVAAQTVAVSALIVRNVYHPFFPNTTQQGAVRLGRIMVVLALAVGVVAAMMMDSVFSALLLVQTVSVPFGAVVMLMFFWRRLTCVGVWAGLLLAIGLNVVGPLFLSQLDSIRSHPALTVRAEDSMGRPQPIYFESVERPVGRELDGDLEGKGRFHLELVIVNAIGFDVEKMSSSGRFAARFFFNAISPFIFLIAVSLLTRPPEKSRVDQFFGRMKTPVGATAQEEDEALAATQRDPHRFDDQKLFPKSSWEFTKWNRVDTIGFVVCCAVSGAIIWLFQILLDLAAGA